MTDFAKLVLEADSREVRNATNDLDNLSKSANKTESSTSKASKGFASMGRILTGLTGIISAVGISAMAKEMFTVARETEKYTAMLKTATGSTQNAAAAFDRLNEFAKTTPYTLQQSIDGFVKLKNLGLDPSEEAMRSYGNTAAAMGKSMEQMIEAVADASTNEFERLKEFGIKARQEGENVTFTFQGVETTIKKSSENIQEYLMNIGNVQFASAMADQVNTIDGQLSNLGQSFDDLWRIMGEGLGVSAVVKKALEVVANSINWISKQLVQLFDLYKKFTVEELLIEQQLLIKTVTELNDKTNKAGRGARNFATRNKELKDKLHDVNTQLALKNKSLTTTEIKLAETDATTGGYVSTLEEATEQLTDFNDELEKLNDLHIQDELFEINAAYDEFIANGGDAAMAQEAFNNAMGKYGQLAEESADETESLKGAIKEVIDEAEPFETTWNRTIERLDNGFADMWRDMLDGSITAMDFIKDAAKDFLAEMIHMFTTKRIVASFGATFGAASAANAAASQGIMGGITNYAGSVGSTLSAGSMALGFGGEQASMLAAQNSGLGFSGISSTFSALGGSLSSLLPIAGVGLGIASLLGLFGGNSDTSPDLSLATGSSNRASRLKWMDTNEAGTDLSFTAQSRYGNIDAMTQHGFFGSEDEAQSFFDNLTAGLNQLDDAIFYAVDESTNAAIESVMGRNWAKEVKFEEGGSVSGIFKERFNRIFDEIGGRMEQVYDTLIKDGTEVEEAVLRVTAAFGALTDYTETNLTDAFAEFTRLQDIANETLYESYNRNLGAINDAAMAFDWSADSLDEMAVLITNNRQLELGLLQQIKNVSESIDTMTGDYKEKWYTSTLDEQGLYDYKEGQAYDIYGSLAGETNPDVILSKTQEIFSLMDSMWSMLPEEGKLEKLSGFQGAADLLNTGTSGLLTNTENTIKVMADKITESITTALQSPAEKIESAANTNATAANTNLAAANTPKRVIVDIETSPLAELTY